MSLLRACSTNSGLTLPRRLYEDAEMRMAAMPRKPALANRTEDKRNNDKSEKNNHIDRSSRNQNRNENQN